MTPTETSVCIITLKPERCREVEITVYPHSTVELVTHEPHDSANTWCSLLVDGRHYRLVMTKFTHGRPEITEALNQALAAVQSTIAALQTPAKPTQPAYTLTEQLEALRKEAHTAQRQGLTEVVTLLKERAADLAESYLDTNSMCDRGHWLNEYGHCETCLEAARQLACARAHVNATLRQWQFEAQTTDCPF